MKYASKISFLEYLISSHKAKNICLIFFIKKEKPDNDELKIFENLGIKYKDDHIKVFYLNVDKYKSIFKSFDNNDVNFENTSAVIVKGKRKKYIPISKENYQNIQIFNNIIESILSGGGSFKQMKKGLILENGNDKTNDL